MLATNRRPTTFVRGQAALEFALLAPALAILLIIVGDAMRVYYTAIILNNAAQAGAAYGAQSPVTAGDLAGMEQAARNDATDLGTINATAALYCACPGNNQTFSCDTLDQCVDKRVYVEVDTSTTFQTLIRYPGFPASLALKGKAVRRAE